MYFSFLGGSLMWNILFGRFADKKLINMIFQTFELIPDEYACLILIYMTMYLE